MQRHITKVLASLAAMLLLTACSNELYDDSIPGLAERILSSTESVAEEINSSGYESGFAKPVSLSTITETGKCNNASFISAVLQESGVFDEGEYIGFTRSDGQDGATKTTLQKALVNAGNIDESKFTVYEVGCAIPEMSDEYLVPGSIFVWDSNIGIYMEDGSVWSLPDSDSNIGYCFRHNVLFAIVPNS